MYAHYTTFTVPDQPRIHPEVRAAEQAFWARNQKQREAAEAKSLEDATKLVQAQTRELNEAAAYNERVNAELEDAKRQLRVLQPELHRRLYSPLWNFDRANRVGQMVPNTMWLVSSLACIAVGVTMLVL